MQGKTLLMEKAAYAIKLQNCMRLLEFLDCPNNAEDL